MALVQLTLAGVLGFGASLVFHQAGFIDLQSLVRQLIAMSLQCAVAGAIWWVARTPRYSDSLVLNLGLAMEVMVCLGGAFVMHMGAYEEHNSIAVMTWTAPMIIFFPLVIPSPPRRVLLVSTIAACTEPLVVFSMWATLPIVPNIEHFLTSMLSPFGAIALAYYASKVLWGLNLEVSRARRLGSYQLEEPLGHGGMGEVWRASHHMLARPAALKFIHPQMLADDPVKAQAVLQRFEQEAQATASLRSPHTIQIYDFGLADDGSFFYVMELLAGLDLHTLVKKFGPQEPARVVYLLLQVCHSLEEAHRAGLIHRDIKPANLFVCRYGTDDDFVKVLDFGLVKEVRPGDNQLLTMHGVVVGTPSFLAPELALGEDKVDGRADLYALGCVAYWLLTGQLVFDGDTPMKQMVQHVKDPPPRPSLLSEHPIPERLEEIIMACLEKEPVDRPESAYALARQLEDCAFARPWTSERAHAWWERHRPSAN